MKKALIAFALTLTLSSCATNPQINQTIANIEKSRLEMEAGKIKKSDYYKAAYQELTKSKAVDKIAFMRGASTMIDASLAYEAGKISKSEFEKIKRETTTSTLAASQEATSHAAQVRAQQSQARSAAFARAATTMNAPIIPYSGGVRDYSGRTRHCTSRRFGSSIETTCY